MQPEIRPILNVEELKLFLPVITDSFLTVTEEFGITHENAPTNPAFITMERLLDIYEKMKCFGMYIENIPSGFFALEGSENSCLMLEKLAVLPDFRHKGYGKLILDYTSMFAAGNNYKIISIAIINENIRLKNWYSLHGFKEIKITTFPHLPFKVCFMELDNNQSNNQ